MPEGISLLDLPQAAIGEIEGGNFVYMVTPDGQPYKVDISQMVAKMQADAGCGCVQTAKLFIPSAEVLQLNTTPKAFGLNVPVGYIPMIIQDPIMQATYGGTAYDTNTMLRIRSVGATAPTVEQSAALSFTTSVLRSLNMATSGTNITVYIAGSDLELLVADGNPLNGDSDITIYLTYMLIEL